MAADFVLFKRNTELNADFHKGLVGGEKQASYNTDVSLMEPT